MKRIICWLLGHKPRTDPIWHAFSTRNGICRRCGKMPAVRPTSWRIALQSYLRSL